jgi:hypothetical protein
LKFLVKKEMNGFIQEAQFCSDFSRYRASFARKRLSKSFSVVVFDCMGKPQQNKHDLSAIQKDWRGLCAARLMNRD